MKPERLRPEMLISGLDATVGDFWAWAYSDLLINTSRGVFAEFVVGSALDAVGGVRTSWDAFDLLYGGAKIEVKSSSYVQRWPQKKPSSISWGIEERFAYSVATDTYAERQARSADCYVFCLFTERDREAADVLDLSKWLFYVVATERVNRELGKQKRVGLRRVADMTDPVGYEGLRRAVDRALNEAE